MIDEERDPAVWLAAGVISLVVSLAITFSVGLSAAANGWKVMIYFSLGGLSLTFWNGALAAFRNLRRIAN